MNFARVCYLLTKPPNSQIIYLSSYLLQSLILNLPLIPYISRLLIIPRPILTPLILFFSITGVYLVSFNTFDIHMMVIITVIAIFLRLLDFPMAPMLLGFILGGIMENNLSRALIISDGSLSFLWERPLTLTIILISGLVLVMPLLIKLAEKIGWLGQKKKLKTVSGSDGYVDQFCCLGHTPFSTLKFDEPIQTDIYVSIFSSESLQMSTIKLRSDLF